MSQPASDNVKQEVATMVNGVKTYAETNRTAIQRLAGTVKTLQQQADARAAAAESVSE
jgi:intracellular multiplication protein IcmG